MKYLLDSNVFIEAKNRYYAFDICPGFWEWMDSVCGGDVWSIRNVRDELTGGSDELAAWAKHRQDAAWFLKVDDEATQKSFADVAAEVAKGGYSQPAMAKFLGDADPWLIAKARVLGATIITHELPDMHSKRRVPIPNICVPFKVPFVNTFDALRKFSTTFQWKPV
jgi:predicted nucleic acid-binding protein